MGARGTDRRFDHAHRIDASSSPSHIRPRLSTFGHLPALAAAAVLAIVVASTAGSLAGSALAGGGSGSSAGAAAGAAASSGPDAGADGDRGDIALTGDVGASLAPGGSTGDGSEGSGPGSRPDASGPIASSLDPAAGGGDRPPEAVLAGYSWPLHDGRITNPFGPSAAGTYIVAGVLFHDGVDIASFCGARVSAAHDGVVLAAGRHYDGYIGWVGDLAAYRAHLDAKKLWSGLAIVVVVDDGNGYRSLYVHLGRAAVKPGQRVHAGDLIGYEGKTGYATGCHLHYSIFRPSETATFATDPKLVKRSKLPVAEIARIDPLLVLPPPETADVTWAWGAR
jgi:murein DD-endopeptidase MepM/ murein hydrolase activator NlpD